jgi:hypothetical protein
MATPATQPEEIHIPLSSLRPGFFRYKSVLRDLRRYQDLIRHRERYGSDIENAQLFCGELPGISQNQENDGCDQRHFESLFNQSGDSQSIHGSAF